MIKKYVGPRNYIGGNWVTFTDNRLYFGKNHWLPNGDLQTRGYTVKVPRWFWLRVHRWRS